MADEPEEGFTFRDRRRVTSDTSPEPPVAPTAPVEIPVEIVPPASGEMMEEGEMDENALPDIYSVLMLFLGEMRSHALLRMGLVPNPMTGQSERDLPQAKIAIDTAVFLVGQLEAVIPPEERLPLRAMLSDLQMAFVEVTRRTGS